MAEIAPAAEGVTTAALPAGQGGHGTRGELEDYGRWGGPLADWWEAGRWAVGARGPNYTWGGWVQDSKDMLQKVVPNLESLADVWQGMIGQLEDKQQVVRATRPMLAGNAGATATSLNTALDETEASIVHKLSNISDNPRALRDAAQVIRSGAAQILGPLDAKYQQVLADRAQCLQVALEAQPIFREMGLALLEAGEKQQASVRWEMEMPEGAGGATQLAALRDSTDETASGTPAAAGAGSQEAGAAKGGTGAGTVVTPSVGLPASAGPPAGPAQLSPSVTLAGAATLAPPTPAPVGPMTAGAPAVSSAPLAAFGPSAVPGVAPGVAPGVMPFAPLATNAATGERTGNRGAKRLADTASATPVPMIAPPGPAAAAARTAMTIRPGVATRAAVEGGRPVKASGIPAGLLGRSAQVDRAGAGSPDDAHLRAGLTRRRRAGASSIEFLDEEAWETDDAGSGVVAPDAPPADRATASPALPGVPAGRE